MKTQSPDTKPEVEQRQLSLLRAMSPREKLEQVRRLNRMVDRLSEEGIRRLYPNANEREVELRVIARKLGPKIMRRVFGWDPDVKGY